jgi:hypothetical protein
MEPAQMTAEVRAAGRVLIERLSDDDQTRLAFEADPIAAMEAAGIPRELMGDLLSAIGEASEADVEGFVVGASAWCTARCAETGQCLDANRPGPTHGCGGGGGVTGMINCGNLGIVAQTYACSAASWYR